MTNENLTELMVHPANRMPVTVNHLLARTAIAHNCDPCEALCGKNASVEPHSDLISGGRVRLFDTLIKSYQCSKCSAEWGIVESAGFRYGHWILRGPEPSETRPARRSQRKTR